MYQTNYKVANQGWTCKGSSTGWGRRKKSVRGRQASSIFQYEYRVETCIS